MTMLYILSAFVAILVVFWASTYQQKRQAKTAAAKSIIRLIASSKQLVDNTMLTGRRDGRAIESHFVPAYRRWFTNAQVTLPALLEPSDRLTVKTWASPLAMEDWRRCKELLLLQVSDLQGMLPRYDDGKLAARFLAEERARAAQHP